MPFPINKIIEDFNPRVEYKQVLVPRPGKVIDSPAIPEKIILSAQPPKSEPPKITPHIVYHKKTPIPKINITKSAPMMEYQALPATPAPATTTGGSFSPNLETFSGTNNSYFATSANLPDLTTWSYYPAISTLNMANNNIINGDRITSGSTVTQWLDLDGNVLTTASGPFAELLLNGVPIATVSDIKDVADWSFYPQISTVFGNNNDYLGLNSISTNTITANNLNVSTINNTVYPPPIPISQWVSTATSDLDMVNYNIGVSTITGLSTINGLAYPPASQFISTATSALNMGSYPIYVSSLLNVSSINGTVFPGPMADVSQWATYPASTDVSLPNRNLNVTSANPGVLYPTVSLNSNLDIGNLSNAPLRPDLNAYCGTITLGGLTTPLTAMNVNSVGGISLTSATGVNVTGGGAVAVSGGGGVAISGGGGVTVGGLGGVAITGAGAISVAAGGVLVSGGGVAITSGGLAIGAGVTAIGTIAGPGGGLNVFGSDINMTPVGAATSQLYTNYINATTPNSLALTGVSTINGAAYPPAVGGAVAFSYNLYVSNVSGNDSTGDGKISNPYKTITKALAVAGLIADSNPVIINLACGTYTESISITRNNTYITGGSTSLSSATIINGTITIDMTGTSGLIVVGGLSSVQITNIVYNNSVAKNQSYIVTDCIIVPGNGVSGIVLTDTSVGGNGDMTVQNSLIYMSDTTAVTVSNCRISFINTQITNNPGLPNATVSMIVTSGTGGVNMFGTSVIQNSTASTVQPLINITNNATTASVMTFNNAILQYTSATADTGTGAKCCLRFSNSAAVTAIVMINNYLICQGATTTNGSAGQFLVVQRTGAGTAAINYGNNLGGTTANHFPNNGGGFTKTAYVIIA